MSYSYELQARVFDCLTALEEKARAIVPTLPNFIDPRVAARAWADQVERKQTLQLTVERQAVDVAAVHRLEGSEVHVHQGRRQGPKIAPRRLTAWRDENMWTYRRAGGPQVAYQAAIMRRVLTHNSRSIQHQDGSEKVVSRVRVTPKGLAKLARRPTGDALAAAWSVAGLHGGALRRALGAGASQVHA